MTFPRQLLLNLDSCNEPSLNNFVVGKNAELVAHLEKIFHVILHAANNETHGNTFLSPAERFIYLWGESGCGRSHLLKAIQYPNKNLCRALDYQSSIKDFYYEKSVLLYIIDDCEKLRKGQQIAAFNLFNEMRNTKDACLVIAGNAAPNQLKLRPDLSTRLSWGLSYYVSSLSDEEKIAAIELSAINRGLILSPGVAPYLLNHFKRNMRTLMSLLDQLEIYSLEKQRSITIPLLRLMLMQNNETSSDAIDHLS